MAVRIFLSVCTGLLLAFSFPTMGFPLLAFFGFVPLLFIEHQMGQQKPKRMRLRLFLLAYLAFVIWNAGCIHWLYGAQQYNEAGILVPSLPAVIPPILINALFMALVFLLYHIVKQKAGNYYGLFFLPCIWMSFENLHLNWDLAFPWLNLGNAFAEYYTWVQWYEYTGSFGGTLWIWVGNLLAFYGIVAFRNTQEKAYLYRFGTILTLWIGIPIAVSYTIYVNYEEKGKQISALVLQPELNPYTEKYATSPPEIVDQMVRLANENSTDDIDFVVAPETAFPGPGPGIFVDYVDQDFLVQKIKNWQSQHPNTLWVSGVELMQKYPNKALATPTARKYGTSLWWVDSYNSAVQFSTKDSSQIYHKSKLLVGIEQFPYANILKPLLGDVLLNFGGTVAAMATQEERGVFTNSMNGAKVAPIICYESVFGQFTTEFAQKGANVFFVMSNDSWWGNSDGHRELFLYGNLRAIENRRSIVRAANSGISGFINQRGDVVERTEYGVETALAGTVFLNEKVTTYTQYGDFIARIALLFSGIILAFTLSQSLLGRIPKKGKRKV